MTNPITFDLVVKTTTQEIKKIILPHYLQSNQGCYVYKIISPEKCICVNCYKDVEISYTFADLPFRIGDEPIIITEAEFMEKYNEALEKLNNLVK